ncbi:MAG TPA: hypothetical protein DCQ64_15980 [Candidatus Rokubacteria bacterium]|nr:hypothetical protein [Candidatus Rokubacteria bacterium]
MSSDVPPRGTPLDGEPQILPLEDLVATRHGIDRTALRLYMSMLGRLADVGNGRLPDAIIDHLVKLATDRATPARTQAQIWEWLGERIEKAAAMTLQADIAKTFMSEAAERVWTINILPPKPKAGALSPPAPSTPLGRHLHHEPP